MFLRTKWLRQVALSCINVDNPTITICSILGIFAPWLNQWVTPSPPPPPQKKKTLLHWLTLPAESGDKVYSVSECVYPDFTPWVNVYTLTNDLKATIYPVFCRVSTIKRIQKKKSVLFNMITKLCVVWWNWTKTFRAAQKPPKSTASASHDSFLIDITSWHKASENFLIK